MTKKMTLQTLRVSSFTTNADFEQVRGGSAHIRHTQYCPSHICPTTITRVDQD